MRPSQEDDSRYAEPHRSEMEQRIQAETSMAYFSCSVQKSSVTCFMLLDAAVAFTISIAGYQYWCAAAPGGT